MADTQRGSTAPADPVRPTGGDDRQTVGGATKEPGAVPGSVGSGAVSAVLWGVAAVVTVVLVHQRYRAAVGGPVGADFSVYLHAARLIAAGHSPYQGNALFVYPPTLALALAPFSHADPTHLWKAWTHLELGSLVAAVGGLVVIGRPVLRTWRQPVLFIIGTVTVLHFWPVTTGLYLGQADAFVFAALMFSAVAATRPKPGVRGALIGGAGLLKAWPAAAGVSLFQRGNEHRRRAVASFALTLMMAPVLAVGFGGGSGLVSFVRSVVAARSQHLVNDSVWGVPTLLFSRSGLARPLAVSGVLQGLATAILVVWVVGLVVVALRTPGDGVLCTWNVTACVVLLLPVSHLAYSLYLLPLLWLWVARLLADGRVATREVAVAGILALWWLIQTRAWPDSGSSPGIGSLHYAVVFAADLIACSASVLGSRWAGDARTDPARKVEAG